MSGSDLAITYVCCMFIIGMGISNLIEYITRKKK